MNEKILLAACEDGSIRSFHIQTGEWIGSVTAISEKDWFAWFPRLRFSGSTAGLAGLLLRKEKRLLPVSDTTPGFFPASLSRITASQPDM